MSWWQHSMCCVSLCISMPALADVPALRLCCAATDTCAHLQLEVAASTCVSCIHHLLHSTSLFLPAVNALYP